MSVNGILNGLKLKGHMPTDPKMRLRRPRAKHQSKIALKYLASANTGDRFSTLELERVGRDLRLLVERLRTREYLRTSFNKRNLLNIIDRTEEIFSDLAFFSSVGRMWQDILKKINIPAKGKVLDIGCGFFPKVELGLLYSGFQGSVTLLDANAKALGGAGRFLEFLHIPFKYRVTSRSIWQVCKIRFDLIAANHVLDDLVLADYCRRRRLNLKNIYSSEDLFKDTWGKIIEDPERPFDLINELATHLTKLVVRGGHVAFVDYPSFSHRSLKLRRLLNLSLKFSETLRSALKSKGFKSVKLFSAKQARYDRLVIREDHCVVMRRP